MKIFNNRLFLCLLSALLLSCGWIGLTGIPLLVAFVPLFIISASYPKGRAGFWKTFGYVAIALSIWSGWTTWWIWYAASIGAVLSVIITLLLFGGIFMLYHWISKRAPLPLALTLLVAGWIAFEYLYNVGEVSFPWLLLGNGFANDIKLVQWYDSTGIFGGSLWVLLSNILIWRTLTLRDSRTAFSAAGVILIPVVISLTVYYTYREEGKVVQVQLVQPNIDPYFEKYILPQDKQTEMLLSLAEEAPNDIDFIVFPETAIHDNIWENNIDRNEIIGDFRNLLTEKYPDAQIILGASTRKLYSPGEKISETARYNSASDIHYDAYNSALAIDTHSPTDIYHKSMLVVGVEKLPYYNLTKHLESIVVDLGGITGQLGYDKERKAFDSPSGVKTGAAICWEGVYGEYFGQYIKKGAQIMWIISNDGWWEDTRGYKQLFLYSRLRAVESRRSIGRSANTGKSGFINQRGDVLSWAGWDVQASLGGELRTNDKVTFYTQYGDYIARICIYVFGLCILYFIAYRVKRRNLLVEEK